jgi:hypothetical protein
MIIQQLTKPSLFRLNLLKPHETFESFMKIALYDLYSVILAQISLMKLFLEGVPPFSPIFQKRQIFV